MKILFVGPLETAALRRAAGVRLPGAPESTGIPIVSLAAEALKRGHDVTIVALAAAASRTMRFDEGRLTVIYVPQRTRARALALTMFEPEIRALTAVLRSLSCDIVHAHWTYEYAEAAIRSRHPHIVTMHDVPMDIFWIFKDAYRLMRLLMALRTIPRIRALTVVSPHLIPWVKWHGYFRKVTAVPNAIEAAIEAQADDGPAWQPGRKPVVVTIGDISVRKNVLASVRALRRIREHYPDAELHLFGPLITREFVGNEPGVIVRGNVPHKTLMKFLAEEATILVHPSVQESFGLIVAEAAIRNVPVVASARAGGPAYVLGDASAGLLTDVTDSDVLAAKTLEVMQDKAGTRRMIDAARRRIGTEFAVERIFERYVELYRKAAATQPKAPPPRPTPAIARMTDGNASLPAVPRRPRILVSAFACDPYGGSENNMGYYFPAALANSGFEVWCLTTLRGKDNIEREMARAPVEHLHFVHVEGPHWLAKRYPIQFFMYLYYGVWQRAAAARAIELDREVNFDLVHHVTWESVQFSTGMWRVGKPLFIGPVGGAQFAPLEFLPAFGWEVVSEGVRWLLSRLLVAFNTDFRNSMRRAKCLFASNMETVRLAKKHGARNVVLMPDPTLPPSFADVPGAVRTRNDGRLHLLWVGRLYRRKGLTFALEALALVPPEVDWTLTIIGAGPAGERIDEKIAALGLGDRVTRKGRVPWTQIREEYVSHDALIFTPFRESVGVQLLEAMSLGLPPIVLDLHGAASFVPPEAGIKVKVAGARATARRFAAAVKQFAELPQDIRERMREAGRAAAAQHLWPEKIRRIIAHYELVG